MDRGSFDRALDELRFDDAAALAGVDPASRLGEEVDRRRAEATEEALQLAQRLGRLVEAHDYRTVLEIDRHPRTHRLLALLDAAARTRSELRLREAHRWEDSRRASNNRRLAEARRALDGLDLDLARGLAAKIDEEVLDEGGRAAYDELLLAVTARTMELEHLETITPPPPLPPRRRWWRRGG